MSLSPRKSLVLLAGVAWAADGLIQIRHSQPDQHWAGIDRVIEAVFALALLASLLALPAVRDLTTRGRLGVIGTRIGQAGFGIMAVSSIASLIHGGNTLGPLFAIGLLLILGGLITLAVGGFRDALVRWAAPMLPVAMVVGMTLGDHGGTVLIGAAWLVLGWLIDADQPASSATTTVSASSSMTPSR